MSLQQFIQKHNIEILWEVISDEDNFKFLTPNIQYNIQQVFINNIKSFYENEKNNSKSLTELNKKYILLILNYIKITYSNKLTKIKIYDEQIAQNNLSQNELITFEEIQNDRHNKFDKQYTQKQQEFESSMTIPVPPVPEFLDKYNDGPIKEMDKIIEQMQKQRNYEVEELKRTHNSTQQTNNWLNPQETSVKNEKLNFNNDNNNNYNKKSVSFDNNNNNNNNKKTVSFDNNDLINIYETPDNNITDKIYNDDEDINIFSKLKMKPTFATTEIARTSLLEITPNDFINHQEDKIIQIERKIIQLDEKMDKILEWISLSTK